MITDYEKNYTYRFRQCTKNYSGNYDKNYIPDIKDGAKEFIEILSKEFDIKLFTSRNIEHAKKWLIKNKLNKYFSDITNKKDLAWLFIDDRCINFTGNYIGLY